jgi:hypothetical protein
VACRGAVLGWGDVKLVTCGCVEDTRVCNADIATAADDGGDGNNATSEERYAPCSFFCCNNISFCCNNIDALAIANIDDDDDDDEAADCSC